MGMYSGKTSAAASRCCFPFSDYQHELCSS